MKRLGEKPFVSTENSETAVFSGDGTPENPLKVEIQQQGGGTEDNPYQIWNLEELKDFRDYVNHSDSTGKYWKLMADIDMGGSANMWFPIGYGYRKSDSQSSYHPFLGNFDGNGRSINNLYMDYSAYTDKDYIYWGFFGIIHGATIKNLTIKNAYLNVKGYTAGILAGMSVVLHAGDGSIISNCQVCGVINSPEQWENNIFYSGGLVGTLTKGTINNCCADVAITLTQTGTSYIGGLIGSIPNISVEGVASVMNCYARGSISSNANYKGGFVGHIGYPSDPMISCYWDTQTSGRSNAVGYTAVTITGVIGKTTAQMKQQTTFVGWNFGSIWTMESSSGYPELRKISGNDIPTLQKVMEAGNEYVGDLPLALEDDYGKMKIYGGAISLYDVSDILNFHLDILGTVRMSDQIKEAFQKFFNRITSIRVECYTLNKLSNTWSSMVKTRFTDTHIEIDESALTNPSTPSQSSAVTFQLFLTSIYPITGVSLNAGVANPDGETNIVQIRSNGSAPSSGKGAITVLSTGGLPEFDGAQSVQVAAINSQWRTGINFLYEFSDFNFRTVINVKVT
ncbi:MAG: hypothetical protein LBH92_03925 [Bacteroidales bacterium]|jgi:hypothetical protein|nr:hypothetical protein [Bacteroidales bacterium]